MPGLEMPKLVLEVPLALGQDGAYPRSILPGSWAGVAEPLRALMAEVERDVRADHAAPPDLAAVSARWVRVSDAIRAAVRARIAEAQAAQSAGAEAIAHRSDQSLPRRSYFGP